MILYSRLKHSFEMYSRLKHSFEIKYKIMQSEQQYQQLLQFLQRPINCLTDEDRNIRKNGLSTILKELDKMEKHNLIRIFTTTNLTKYLIRTFNDKIEANRQLSLDIVEKMLAKLGEEDLKKDQIEPIIQNLILRINNTPFPEKNQEIRLKVLNLLKKMLVFKDAFVFNISDLCNALSKCLQDPCADIKMSVCHLIDDICKKIKNIIGKYSTSIVKSLALNLTYYKYPVRKATLVTLGKLLVTESAGSNFQHIQNGLKAAINDAKIDVRKSALECTAELLLYFGPKYLKQHEPFLVNLLISGLSDESQEIIDKAKVLLEQCGQNLKKLYEQEMEEESTQNKILPQEKILAQNQEMKAE